MCRRYEWLILMLKHQKEQAFTLRYYVPMGFVLTILGLGTVGLMYPLAWWLLAGVMGVYVLTGLAAATSMRMVLGMS